MYELRPYQHQAYTEIEAQWGQGIKRTLLALPTGTGKTIVFSKIIENRVREGERVLVLAHREELLNQAADKLSASTGLGCAVEKAGESCLGSFYRVAVGSVQTLMREKRLAKFPPDYFGTIIVDECHHALADSYQRVLQYFEGAKVLGVTATPDRGDKRNLGKYFESLAYEYGLLSAVKEGYLAPIRAETIPLELDLSGVGVQNGDFAADELGDRLEPYLEQIAVEMRKYCAGRKTVVFLPLIKTARRFCELLRENGFRAAEVNGNSPDRSIILDDFDRGVYEVLCNAMLLTEGWDCPSVDCIIVLRPTKIRSLYAQMVGRGTRIHPGKEDLLIPDFLWHTERHELCRPASLISQTEETAKRMTEIINAAGYPMDLQDALEMAERDAVREREQALAKMLKEMKNRKRKLVDPLQFELSIQAEDLAGYEPAFAWEMGPPTDKQIAALEKWGIFPDEIECCGKASKILDRLNKRRLEGLATPKQIRLLESKGFMHVGEWPFDAANKMISRLANNKWWVPSDVDAYTYVPVAVERMEAVGW